MVHILAAAQAALPFDLPACPPPLKKVRARRRFPREIVEDPQQCLELVFPTEEEFLAMSEEEISVFREGLIHKAFAAVVDGRVAKSTRKEWWEWIADSDLQNPFSFFRCAAECNADPEDLRAMLLSLVRRKFPQFDPKNLI